MLIDVSVKVEKSGYDLQLHLAKIVSAVKLSGGFKVSAIPMDIAALVAELPGIVEDCSALPADVVEDKLAFAKGCVLGAELVVEAVLAKAPAA